MIAAWPQKGRRKMDKLNIKNKENIYWLEKGYKLK
jgi:hypothetical protein